MTDERLGLASASEMHRVVACPGYLQLKKLSGDPHNESKAAQFGTQIHAALAGEQIDLTTYQHKQKLACDKIREKLCLELLGEDVKHSIVETRFYLRNMAGVPIFSSKPDYVGCNDQGQWLLVEYKTLPGEVDDAPDNWQLLSQAVCLLDDEGARDCAKGIGITEIYAAIVQPSVTDKPVAVKYSIQQLEGARLMLEQKLEHSLIPGAPRIPGHHCNNCPCASNCIEGQSVALIIAKKKLDVNLMSGDQLAEILPMVPAVKSICEAITKRVKEMLANDPNSIPGYTLTDWPGDRYITNLKQARDLVGKWMTPAEFSALLTLPIGKLEEFFQTRYSEVEKVTKITAGKKFEEIMKPVVERSKPTKRIVRKKAQ